jgi:hypothetical protein
MPVPWWERQPVAGTICVRLLYHTWAALAARTMMPATRLVTDGASLKHTHTHATANGVSSVLINAFSVANTIRPPIVSSMTPRPNWVVPIGTASADRSRRHRAGRRTARRYPAVALMMISLTVTRSLEATVSER